MENEPKVDLSFSITGRTIPVDHGFDLYSAVSRVIPEFHEADVDSLNLRVMTDEYI
jgi:hypothetical protein